MLLNRGHWFLKRRCTEEVHGLHRIYQGSKKIIVKIKHLNKWCYWWQDVPATMTGREIHQGPAIKFEKKARKWDPMPILIEPNTMHNPPAIRSSNTWYLWGLLPRQQFLWSSERSASSAIASWTLVIKSLESMSISNSTAARWVVSDG